MMTNALLIGIVAGLVAALLFATAAVGSVPVRAAVVLTTGLPFVISGMGWGWPAAAAGALAGSFALATIVNPTFALAFFVTQALPAVLLVRLAGLSRGLPGAASSLPAPGPAAANGSPTAAIPAVEWYPPGRIVIAAAILSGLLGFGFMLMLGPDLEQIRTSVRAFAETFATKILPEVSGGAKLEEAEIAKLAEITLVVLPAAMAVSVMAAMLFNLWLGSRLAQAGGVLLRPWPDLASLEFPRGTQLMLAVATAGTFVSGHAGLAAASFFGALFLAYLFLGLAVIHHVTRGHPWRAFALWGIYGAVIVFSSVAMPLIAVLGLADGIRPLRQTGAPPATGGPPPQI